MLEEKLVKVRGDMRVEMFTIYLSGVMWGRLYW